MHYYLEAHDDKGEVIARSGQSTSPHLVIVDREARPSYYSDLDGRPGFEPGPRWGPLRERPAGAGDISRSGPGDNSPPGAGRDAGGTGWGLTAAKWGATAGTAVFVGSFVLFYRAAGDEAESLENEGAASATECELPPCRAFSEFQKDREKRGQRFETLARVSLALGVASAGVATYLWYLDLGRGNRRDGIANRRDRVAVPVIGRQYIGAAATWSF